MFCHFVLLWLADPRRALNEMRRVAAPGGAVLALAEPDYGGRIDYPEALSRLGTWQSQALEEQGANPRMGRRLAGLFQQAGLVEVESGVLGAQWSQTDSDEDMEMEWQVLRNDLAEAVPPEELEALERLDRQATQAGERVLFVPTFYAWGGRQWIEGESPSPGAAKSFMALSRMWERGFRSTDRALSRSRDRVFSSYGKAFRQLKCIFGAISSPGAEKLGLFSAAKAVRWMNRKTGAGLESEEALIYLIFSK